MASQDKLTLIDLPVELILTILTHVPPEEVLVNVSPTCKRLHEATKIEWFWDLMCEKYFKIPMRTMRRSDRSAKIFCQKILLPYGSFVGLWSRRDKFYGSLHQMVFDEDDWGLTMIQWYPPINPKVCEGLRPFKFASITIDWETPKKDVKVQLWDPIVALGLDGEPNSIRIGSRGAFLSIYKCRHETTNDDMYRTTQYLDPDGPLYSGFARRERGPRQGISDHHERQQLYFKYSFLVGFCRSPDMREFGRVIPSPIPFNVYALAKPIQPGFFKGTYGPHGIEIIQLLYSENSKLFKAVKITGDPNVPAREVTFQGDVEDAFGEIPVEDQVDFSKLTKLEPHRVNWSSQKSPTSFRLPQSCFNRADVIFENEEERRRIRFAKSRFKCHCQVAGHSYSDPLFIDGHFVVFDRDIFGVIFLDLRSFSIFHRVKENLTSLMLRKIGQPLES